MKGSTSFVAVNAGRCFRLDRIGHDLEPFSKHVFKFEENLKETLVFHHQNYRIPLDVPLNPFWDFWNDLDRL